MMSNKERELKALSYKPYLSADGRSIVYRMGNEKIAYPIDRDEAAETIRKGEVQ